MHEVLPVVAGIVVGLLAYRVDSRYIKLAILLGLSVIFGVMATVVSGEVLISWGFFPVDIALVLLAAAATTVVVTRWQRRSALLP